jgi:hypothetical protein
MYSQCQVFVIRLVPLSSRPIGHAHTGLYGSAIIRHRLLHPALFLAQGFVPELVNKNNFSEIKGGYIPFSHEHLKKVMVFLEDQNK